MNRKNICAICNLNPMNLCFYISLRPIKKANIHNYREIMIIYTTNRPQRRIDDWSIVQEA